RPFGPDAGASSAPPPISWSSSSSTTTSKVSRAKNPARPPERHLFASTIRARSPCSRRTCSRSPSRLSPANWSVRKVHHPYGVELELRPELLIRQNRQPRRADAHELAQRQPQSRRA